jgi:hypothetical protein
MKKIIGFIILICLFATCQDSNKLSTDRKQSLREVGRLITKEEAERWRARYERGSDGMRQQSAATISKATLQNVVAAMAEYDGVYFHHAMDDGNHHVFVIPYKDSQSLWGSVVVDANSDSTIDPAIASVLAGRYVAQNPDGPWSHFFGRHVFESILSKEGFQEMEIVPAVNDAGLPQLLLYVSYSDVSINGRTHEQVEVYDLSNPCPPYCS